MWHYLKGNKEERETISVSTRIDEQILKEIEKLAQEMNLERGSLIRKFILDGFQTAKLRRSIGLVRRGDLSIEQAAEDAGVSLYHLLEVAREMDVEIGADNTTMEYETKSLKKLQAARKIQ